MNLKTALIGTGCIDIPRRRDFFGRGLFGSLLASLPASALKADHAFQVSGPSISTTSIFQSGLNAELQATATRLRLEKTGRLPGNQRNRTRKIAIHVQVGTPWPDGLTVEYMPPPTEGSKVLKWIL